jgi:enoyl-CoA hydratase/carnithine racemase
MERDYFLDAQQALEMGLVDKVLTSRDEQDEVMAPLRKAKDDKSDGGNGGNGGGDGGAAGGQAGGPPSPIVNPSPS